MMNERIFSKVRAYIEKYHMLAPGDTVVAGVSGGADSVCLLLMLYELSKEMKLRIGVVHINHGIRADAAKDAQYVEKLCRERDIPFFLAEEDVKSYAKKEKLSEEEAGRKVRYQAFYDILESRFDGRGKIAVAHNANDRAETMLFHLFRGTGLAGVSGIKPTRGNVIRPLLVLCRSEIEEYLGGKGISFCIDHTNMEDTYTRNRIRNHILPYAEKEICHGAVGHMCEAADMLLEAEKYIGRQAESVYRACLILQEEKRIIWNAEALKKEEAFIRGQVFLIGLEALTQNRKDITSVHISAIGNLLHKEGSRRISLPYGLTAAIEYDRLILSTKKQEGTDTKTEERMPFTVKVPGQLKIPGLGEVEFSLIERKNDELFEFIPEKSCTKWFDYDRITKSLEFRIRETGDYLTINEKLSRKTLKEYMIGEKIPSNQRGSLYVLADGNHILWVPGYRISQYYKITPNTKRILQVRTGGNFNVRESKNHVIGSGSG